MKKYTVINADYFTLKTPKSPKNTVNIYFFSKRVEMKPIRDIEEFERILVRAKKKHEKLELKNVSLEILEVEMKPKQLQKTLDGKETWHGICTRKCWFAKGKRCRCRCKGLGHGKGLKKKKEE